MKPVVGNPVRLYHVWAEPNAPLPYLVHRLKTDYAGSAVRRGLYFIDAWDYGPTSDRVWQMRKALLASLDEQLFNTSESTAVRLWLDNDDFIPTDAENVWRLGLQFHVRYGRDAELAAIRIRG